MDNTKEIKKGIDLTKVFSPKVVCIREDFSKIFDNKRKNNENDNVEIESKKSKFNDAIVHRPTSVDLTTTTTKDEPKPNEDNSTSNDEVVVISMDQIFSTIDDQYNQFNQAFHTFSTQSEHICTQIKNCENLLLVLDDDCAKVNEILYKGDSSQLKELNELTEKNKIKIKTLKENYLKMHQKILEFSPNIRSIPDTLKEAKDVLTSFHVDYKNATVKLTKAVECKLKEVKELHKKLVNQAFVAEKRLNIENSSSNERLKKDDNQNATSEFDLNTTIKETDKTNEMRQVDGSVSNSNEFKLSNNELNEIRQIAVTSSSFAILTCQRIMQNESVNVENLDTKWISGIKRYIKQVYIDAYKLKPSTQQKEWQRLEKCLDFMFQKKN